MHKKIPLPYLIFGAAPLLLAGCGGGGGGSSSGPAPTNYGSISGEIVDTSGTPVPSAVLTLDNVPLSSSQSNSSAPYVPAGASFPQGGYKIDNVSPGFHIVGVSTTVSGVTYTGNTQIYVPNVSPNALTNTNLIVSPQNEQATVSGYVTSNGQPVGGAEVFFNSSFASTPPGTTIPSNISLVAVTESNGFYQITNLPVQNTLNNTARQYAITASYPTGNPQSAFNNSAISTQTFTAGQNVANLDLSLASASGSGSLTPSLNYIESVTQPDIPADSTAHAIAANGSSSVYLQIEKYLSPEYAKLLASGRAPKAVKRLVSAQFPHATSSSYTVQMNLFFSMPGDTSSGPDPNRNELSGFQILSSALSANGGLQSYDFLEDPLANYYDDADVGSSPTYLADSSVQFAVQSVAADGVTQLGVSNTGTAEPLSFVNLSSPVDPNDQNGAVTTLPASGTVTWSTVDPNKLGSPNYRIGSYTLFIYSQFPGISTTPTYTSSSLSGSTNSATLPNSLTPGQEYWLVIAASASSEPTDSNTGQQNTQAISVSQIVPFYVQ